MEIVIDGSRGLGVWNSRQGAEKRLLPKLSTSSAFSVRTVHELYYAPNRLTSGPLTGIVEFLLKTSGFPESEKAKRAEAGSVQTDATEADLVVCQYSNE
ncbi:MAG: hypothetical protein R3C49_19045 [Planctomycetaceae bacterium]